MSKGIELEAKFEITKDKFDELIKKFNTHPSAKIVDYYFAADKDEYELNEYKGIRIRRKIDKDILCYKEIHFHNDSSYIDEYETVIDDFDDMIKILEKMGYKTVVVIDKDRSVAIIDNFELSFDYIKDLGYFIEIEIVEVNDDVESLQEHLLKFVNEIGLNIDNRNTDGYSNMYYKRHKNLLFK